MRVGASIPWLTLVLLVACTAPDSKGPDRVAAARPIVEVPEAGAEWLARARAHIADREYWASESKRGLQAPNRRHDFRTYFSNEGVRVHDRTAHGSPALVEFELVRLRRGDVSVEVAAGEVSYVEGRVEIARNDLGLTEWFVNDAEGLEQGFTFERRPLSDRTVGGRGDGDRAGAKFVRTALPSDSDVRQPLVLELAVDGAALDLRDQTIVIETGANRRLRYGGLFAYDAERRPLEARFGLVAGERLRIVVDDHDAIYPIVIDPILTAAADAQLESDQGGADLGVSLAGAGDVNGDGYDDVIVGAPGYDAGQLDEGAAFIFEGGPSGVASGGAASAMTQLESNQSGNPFADGPPQFGSSVAGAGDVNGDGYDDVIVGAFGYNAGEIDEGAAFVFLGSATGVASGGPEAAATLLQSDVSPGFFGEGVPRFGESVSGAGDVDGDGYDDVIVGASLFSTGQSQEGAAFIFLGSAAGIADGNPTTAATQLESNSVTGSIAFGASVSGAGDVDGDGYDDVIVGAALGQGAAYVFPGSAAGVADAAPGSPGVTHLSGQFASGFGTSVAGAGDVNGDGFADVIVGAPTYDAGTTDEGAAFVFLGSATGIPDGDESGAARLESNQGGSRFGQRVAGAGDVNGDGRADVAVGAPNYDGGQTDEGAIFVFAGSAAGVAPGGPEDAWGAFESDQADAWLGWSVAGAGDVDGDGYDDVIGGAFLYDAPLSREGAAFVYRGGAAAPGQTLAFPDGTASLVSDLYPGRSLGFFSWGPLIVNPAGDLDADGHADYAVGVPTYDGGEPFEGAVFVFLGAENPSEVGLDQAHAHFESDQPDAFLAFGTSAGDVNGDGYGDLIVSGNGLSNGEAGEGVAYVLLGSATGVSGASLVTPHARLENDQASAGGGLSAGVAGSAGDVNGDGFGDVIMMAPAYDAGEANEGAAFIYLGSAAGLSDGNPSTAHARLQTNQSPVIRPEGIASAESAGDVNGDGFDDVALTVPEFDPGNGQREKAAFVFLGSADGIADGDLSTAHAQIETLLEAAAGYPLIARSAGDVDGDGYGDLLLVDGSYSLGETREGAAFLLLGSATGIASRSLGGSELIFETDVAGSSLSTPGGAPADLDGDGYADVVVETGADRRLHVLFGSPNGIAAADPMTADVTIQNGPQGTSALIGDLNGDGFADLLRSGAAEYSSDPLLLQGSVGVVFGNGGGRPVRPAQRRGDGSGIAVAPGGSAYSPDSFVVELIARSPRSSERAKLEVEVCPLATAFGDPACMAQTSASWISLGSSGTLLSHAVTGLAAEELYTWRARAWYAPDDGAPPPATLAGAKPGPWFRLQARGAPGDIRTTVPEPGAFALLAAGSVVLGAMDARRRARRRGRSPGPAAGFR